MEEPFQQADGAYSETPEDFAVVHALEHGRMAIQYSPALPDRAQRELIGLYEVMYSGTLLYPNHRIRSEIAVTTWTNLLSCDEYRETATLEAIRAFGRATWGRFGGEPMADLDPGAPTPTAPSF